METQTAEQELVQLENEYWQALKDQDVDAALRLTDDECIVTGPQGVASIDRDALKEMMTNAQYSLSDYDLSDVQARMLSDDVAIVAYKVKEKLTVEGKPVTLEAADAFDVGPAQRTLGVRPPYRVDHRRSVRPRSATRQARQLNRTNLERGGRGRDGEAASAMGFVRRSICESQCFRRPAPFPTENRRSSPILLSYTTAPDESVPDLDAELVGLIAAFAITVDGREHEPVTAAAVDRSLSLVLRVRGRDDQPLVARALEGDVAGLEVELRVPAGRARTRLVLGHETEARLARQTSACPHTRLTVSRSSHLRSRSCRSDRRRRRTPGHRWRSTAFRRHRRHRSRAP